MTDPSQLSSAAQTVVNSAIELDYGQPTPMLYRRLAAALRAAADQLSYCLDGSDYYVIAKDDILAIANELEALVDGATNSIDWEQNQDLAG